MDDDMAMFVRDDSDDDLDGGGGKRKKSFGDGGMVSRGRRGLVGRSGGERSKVKGNGKRSGQSGGHDAEVKEMWDTIAGGDSEDDKEGTRMVHDNNFIHDSGVDPSERSEFPVAHFMTIAVNSGQYMISYAYDGSYGSVGRILDHKYLNPSQELLEEVANLREALSQLKRNRPSNLQKLGVDDKDSKFTTRESTISSSGELSASEKQDLPNKVTKLFSLLDVVDRNYREYYQQLRIVEAALDVVSGSGAARTYTALAHQTISHHFRCLRDAINGQIQLTRKSLGEQDDSADRVLPRLKNVEKQLRQQRNLHHLGGNGHSWRPQRGLPEGSVSILRAWLFEHFLNPYLKDSEKLMLAKQTGLTRSQIANWFINARVRLWKPMIEDIYKEEFGDAKGHCISSQKHAYKSLNDNSSSSEYKELPIIGEPSKSNPNFFNQMEASRVSEPQLSSDL
ncbi:hypothetical protein M8C21_019915, partial [Ambrosia artemisiifolia]